MKPILALFAVLLLQGIALCGDLTDNSYSGIVKHGHTVAMHEMTFSLDDQGQLTGQYRIEHDEWPAEGSLTLKRRNGNAYTFVWRDQYGEGDFKLIHNTKANTFQGRWTPDGKQWFKWDGKADDGLNNEVTQMAERETKKTPTFDDVVPKAIPQQVDDNMWIVGYQGSTYVVTTDGQSTKVYQKGVRGIVHAVANGNAIEDACKWIRMFG